MNEELYEWFSVSDPHPYTVRTSKYDYEGIGRTTKYLRVDRPVCCSPVFKETTDQTMCVRKKLRGTSKYSPEGDKQLWRKR